MKALSGDFPIKVHPGEILQELLDENGMSQAQLARHLHMDTSKLNEICRGRRGISADMAVILGKAFGMSPGTWLNLQKNWELSLVDASLAEGIEPLRLRAWERDYSIGRRTDTAFFSMRPELPGVKVGQALRALKL